MGRIAAGAVVYMYTVGVIVTGVYLERTWGEIGETAILVASLAVALGWALYYHVAIKSRVARLSRPGESWRPSEGDDEAED